MQALTSQRHHVFLLDGGVELQRQLRGGAQESLDDCGALEGIPVCGQFAFRLADLPLHGRVLAFLQLDLPGDGDVWFLLLSSFEIHPESLETPAGENEELKGCSCSFTPAEGSRVLVTSCESE